MDKSQSVLLHQLLQLGDITYIQKSKANIIAAFESLDAETLRYLLDESNTYQNATKDVFIQKISEVFAKLGAKGDSKLQSYPGKCGCDSCSSFERTGYTFVGNKSGDHLDLIFKENDGEIMDIYTCSDFHPDEDIVVGDEVEIDISHDERADFTPSVAYLLKSSKCKTAIAELGEPGAVVLRADFLYWLEKHHELYSSFRLPPIRYRKYYDFYKSYSSIRYFFNWIPNESELQSAMADFIKLPVNNEAALIGWLVSHEELWNEVIGRSYEYDDHDNKLDVLAVTYNPEFLVRTSECGAVAEFLETYQGQYWPVFEKYRTTTDKDIEGVVMSSEQWRQCHSLSWHLTQRGL